MVQQGWENSVENESNAWEINEKTKSTKHTCDLTRARMRTHAHTHEEKAKSGCPKEANRFKLIRKDEEPHAWTQQQD